MRTLSILSLALATAILATPANAAEELKADLEKCKISFVGGKPDGTKHKGGFKKFEVQATADYEDASNSSLRIEIKTESLWSDADKLTAHLKNPDFFDVRKFPKAVFESTSIEPDGEGTANITGKLKLLDKVEEIKVPVTVEVSDEAIQLKGKFKIDRTKWGMDYMVGKINKEVEMEVELHFKR